MASLGKFLIDRLVNAGVRSVFGVPGDYNLTFYDLLHKSNINTVTCCSEANAGFAADAYARIAGMGCVVVTYGVGGFSVLNAAACAYAEKSPLVIISGAPGIAERNSKMLLHHLAGNVEDQAEMFKRVTCDQAILNDSDKVGFEIDRVLSSAKHFKQPVYIELPKDMVDKAIRYDPYSRGTPPTPKSDEQILAEAVGEVTRWLTESKQPVIWAGVETARFELGQKLMRWCEINKIPVATTVLGKSVVNEAHPLALGVYCETVAREELRSYMDSSDCMILLGVMMTDMNLGFKPFKYGKRNIVSATTDNIRVRNHTFTDVLFSDFAEALFKVRLPNRVDPKLPAKTKWADIPTSQDTAVTAEHLFAKVNSVLTAKTAIVADIGDALFGSLDIMVQDTNKFVSDAFYTCMGFAVPAAVGVAMACPDCRPIVLVGDGAFQMTGQEYSTLVRLKIPAIVFVIDNKGFMTERLILDGPFNDVHQWNFEKMADVMGGTGYRVRTVGQLNESVARALESKSPSIIHVELSRGDHSPALKRLFSNLNKKI